MKIIFFLFFSSLDFNGFGATMDIDQKSHSILDAEFLNIDFDLPLLSLPHPPSQCKRDKATLAIMIRRFIFKILFSRVSALSAWYHYWNNKNFFLECEIVAFNFMERPYSDSKTACMWPFIVMSVKCLQFLGGISMENGPNN